MSNLPTGTVTFLFTDIEGSTRLAQDHPERWELLRERHHAILHSAMDTQQGYIFHVIGDAFCVAFCTPRQALSAALQAQAGLHLEDWGNTPIKVRMGIHTGKAEIQNTGDYNGYLTLSRVQRLMSAGHGEQTLISQETEQLLTTEMPENVSLCDLGEHQLKDLIRPEHIYQVITADLPSDFPALKALDARLNNLPTQLTPFIGREHEVASVLELIRNPDVRLVTLTGTGGTGKTRLSLQVAGAVIDQFPDGIYFVPMAETSELELAVSKIAQVLEVREGNGRYLIDTLKDYLADKTLLLILDNFEQLVGSASLTTGLLVAASKIKLLISSRIVLRMRGEHEFPVLPLEIPDPSDLPALEQLQQNESIQLFIQRARAANPKFALTKENAPAVAAICQALEGLPLAIELAAARIKILPPQAMLAKLSNRLSFLTGGAGDLPARQQTLRNTLNWSYNLLSGQERTLFARLGIFAGGFSLEAAESICNLDGTLDVLGGVEILLNNSLLRQEEHPYGGNRFIMLGTVREYALEELEKQAELATLTRVHAIYYVSKITRDMGFNLFSSEAVTWLDWCESELDNIRAALDWAQKNPEADQFKSVLILLLSWFWYRRGYLREGRVWSERFLGTEWALPGTVGRAGALLSSAMLALWQGEAKTAFLEAKESVTILQREEDEQFLPVALLNLGIVNVNMGNDAAAHPLLKEAGTLFLEAGQKFFYAVSLVHLGNVALGLGNPTEARTLLEKAYPLAREVGDQWAISFALNNLGEVARVLGDYDQARQYYEESESLLRVMGDPGDLARLVHNLGSVAQHEGNFEKARSLYSESLAMFRKFGNKRGIAECLMGLAGLKAEGGQPQQAARLFSAAEAILAESGTVWWPADRAEVEHNRTVIQSRLDQTAFRVEYELGQKMPLTQAFAEALEQT
jgi:predicted ATPase/class 3 adenylate cyclase/Tfp pilus assembly protein PilF